MPRLNLYTSCIVQSAGELLHSYVTYACQSILRVIASLAVLAIQLGVCMR